MAFSVSTTTLGGNTARLITGDGNLDDLASALSTHGVTQSRRTITFAGTGAATYYRMDGDLTEQRDGIWTVIVGTNSFMCWSASGATTILGLVDSNGARSSRVDIVYNGSSLAAGADPYSADEFRCFAGAGTLNFHAGSLKFECSSRSDMDVRSTVTSCTFDDVDVQQQNSSSYAHIMTSANVSTTAKTRFTVYPEFLEFVASISTVNPVSIDSGVRLLYKGAASVTTVLSAKYTKFAPFGSTAGAIANATNPAGNYFTSDGGTDPIVLNILRTVATTFKDQLGTAITSPAPNLIAVKPDASTVTTAYSAGAASYDALQSYTTASVAYTTGGTGYTDLGTYDFYAVGFGYAAQTLAMNVKTAHAGNDGISWAGVAIKSPLVTTAYASVTTAGFALTTGTDTLAITTSRTTSQGAEYLFKHAYDNPTESYWRTRLHTPATQHSTGYIDFAATNITVTGVALSGTAFSTTGTITLASSATCSAPIVKSSGVISSGDIDNVTGSVTLTGTARWDITTGGTAPAGSAAATNTIRVTTAAAAADFNFEAFTFNASTTFENTSGNNITVTLGGGQTQPTKLETSGTITFVAPTVTQGLAFTGLVAGSQVVVYTTTTTTELFRDDTSATSETWSQSGGSDTTVDYTVMKAGYLPIRVVGVTVNSAVVSTPIVQQVDRAYVASSGLTFGTTATVNAGTSRFAVSAVTTVQNWYSFLIEAWIAQSALRNVAFPVVTNGPNSFSAASDWEFTTEANIVDYFRGDGFRYVNTAGTRTAAWAALQSVGVPSGATARYQQSDGGTTTNAIATGEINQLVKVYGDASHGNFDRTGYLVAKVQLAGYDQAETDIFGLYGTLEDQLYVFGLTPVSNGVATGDPALTITVTDHGASPVTWNGKDFSVTITDNATPSTGTNILRELRHNFAAGGTYQGKDGFNWHDLVQVNGSKFKTVRGKLYGDTGATLKGVRVVTSDGTTVHPDFDLFTADDGTTYAPPVVANVSITGLTNAGAVPTRLQLINTTALSAAAWASSTAYADGDVRKRTTGIGTENTAGLYMRVTTAGTSGGSEPTWNTTPGGTTTDGTVTWTTYKVLFYDADPAATSYTTTYTEGNEFVAGETVTLRFAEMNGATTFKRGSGSAITSSTGFSIVATIDTDAVYATNALDGESYEATFSPNFTTNYIVLDANADFSGKAAYAYFCFTLTSSNGLYSFWGGVTAVDAGNYRIESSVLNLYFDESAGFVKQTDDVRIYRADGTRPAIDPTTGGHGIEINWRVPVSVVSTGGSALTPTESAYLLALPSAAATATATLSAAASAPIAANIEQVNAQTISGTGTTGDPWGP